MLKIITVMVSIFALTSCSSQQVNRQPVSQPTPVEAETKAPAEVDGNQIVGQTIYVPIYSHIYIRDKGRVINLAATLSIRNTDAQSPIRITSARYYDTNGALVLRQNLVHLYFQQLPPSFFQSMFPDQNSISA